MERARSFEKECRLEAVRRSEQLRGAVLDALAHEIKTPLAVIRTASSGMLAAGGLAEREGALVTLIDEQVERLGLLTSRLLQTARLDREELAPSRERLLLSEVAAAAVQGLSPPGSGSRVRLIPPDRETAVMADRDLLTTALAHLLDNAVKYSLPESPIEVRVARSDARMKATVRNRGKVISPAERERIFERFYRTPEARDGPEGTGLGLSIVKKIVEAHQGAVWAEPDAGDGMVFSLALPSAPPSEP
jgi:two-component system sensor histidine kinase KdpD